MAWWDYYIWLMANKKGDIIEKLLDFLLGLSALAFVGSMVIYGLLFLGIHIPDNKIWLVPQEPSKKDLTEMSLMTYNCLRGLMIVCMTMLYSLCLGLIVTFFSVCTGVHLNEFRGEYEEEMRLKQLYDKNLRGESLNAVLLHV